MQNIMQRPVTALHDQVGKNPGIVTLQRDIQEN
jgi:hypothetical protein